MRGAESWLSTAVAIAVLFWAVQFAVFDVFVKFAEICSLNLIYLFIWFIINYLFICNCYCYIYLYWYWNPGRRPDRLSSSSRPSSEPCQTDRHLSSTVINFVWTVVSYSSVPSRRRHHRLSTVSSSSRTNCRIWFVAVFICRFDAAVCRM